MLTEVIVITWVHGKLWINRCGTDRPSNMIYTALDVCWISVLKYSEQKVEPFGTLTKRERDVPLKMDCNLKYSARRIKIGHENTGMALLIK